MDLYIHQTVVKVTIDKERQFIAEIHIHVHVGSQLYRDIL